MKTKSRGETDGKTDKGIKSEMIRLIVPDGWMNVADEKTNHVFRSLFPPHNPHPGVHDGALD